MIRTSILTAAFVLAVSHFALAQETKATKETHADETAASVPILTDFHEVIFTIWHTAWPEKNIPMLSQLAPDVRRYADSLAKVELPGILRDKEAQWREKVEELQTITGEYEKSASSRDSVSLLDAAERLHAQYEGLVRLIRPPLKEVDEFHQVLYMIYHHHLPQKNVEKLTSAVSDLKEKMAALDSVKLPERQKKREAAFIEARKKLSASVASLDVAQLNTDFAAFAAAVESVHSDYQALERVFE